MWPLYGATAELNHFTGGCPAMALSRSMAVSGSTSPQSRLCRDCRRSGQEPARDVLQRTVRVCRGSEFPALYQVLAQRCARAVLMSGRALDGSEKARDGEK